MSTVFLEKAFWGFLALVGALIVVIYRLFNSTINKDLQLQKNEIKSEIEKEVEARFILIEKEINFIQNNIKKNEANSVELQLKFLKEILEKNEK